MNTSTLRGIFPDPKPVYRKNFVRENIKQLKEMQGFIQQEQEKNLSKSQELKPNKFKHVAPKVYSNITSYRKLSKDSLGKRPLTHNQASRGFRGPLRGFYNKTKVEKAINRGVQTERPEDVPKLYETGVLKYPSPSVLAQSKSRGRDQGDVTQSKLSNRNESPHNLAKNMQKLDLDDKPDHVKQNIKNLKTRRQEQSPDPNLAPATYQKGVVPKYLKERKEGRGDVQPVEFTETENLAGLVLLPDDERKEYLRVARENYAGLIKELNSMPVSNDTLKKRKRKMEIEDELTRLDEVIKIFQKPKVFVKADA